MDQQNPTREQISAACRQLRRHWDCGLQRSRHRRARQMQERLVVGLLCGRPEPLLCPVAVRP